MSEFCNAEQVQKILLKYNLGPQTKDSKFLVDGNSCLPKCVKHGIIRNLDANVNHNPSSQQDLFSCNIPGCTQTFKSPRSYETHYNTLHRYACSVCHKNLPSPHLLDLHIEESHDSFFAVQTNKRPMYSCFIEECKHKSQDPKERRDHCIKEHKFPHDFRFAKMQNKKQTSEKMEIEVDNGSENKEKLIEIPKTFHFGHHSAKRFVTPKFKKESVLESESLMKDLAESLPNT